MGIPKTSPNSNFNFNHIKCSIQFPINSINSNYHVLNPNESIYPAFHSFNLTNYHILNKVYVIATYKLKITTNVAFDLDSK